MLCLNTVADPDLQISGGRGGGHPDPEIGEEGGERSSKIVCRLSVEK